MNTFIFCLVPILDIISTLIPSIYYQNDDWFDKNVKHFDFQSSIGDIVGLAIVRVFLGVVLASVLQCNKTKSIPVIIGNAIVVLFNLSSCGYAIVKISSSTIIRHDLFGVLVLSFSILFSIIHSVYFGFHCIWQFTKDSETDANDEQSYILLEENQANNKTNQGTSLKRVMLLAWPERWMLFNGTIALFVAVACQLILPKLFIRAVAKSQSIDTTLLEIIGVLLISAVFTFIRGILFTLAGERIVARLRATLFDKVIHLDVEFFDTSETGELQSRLSNDTSVIQSAVTSNVSMGLRWSAQVVIGLIILFVYSWQLSLVMISVVPALAIGAQYFGSYMREVTKGYQNSLANAGQVAEQAFSSIRTVRSFAKESKEVASYGRMIQLSYQMGRKRAFAYAWFISLIGLFVYLSILLVLWFGVQVRHVAKDTLSEYLLYTLYVALGIGGLSNLFSTLMSAVGASERIFKILDTKTKINNRVGPEIDGATLLNNFSNGEFEVANATEDDIDSDHSPGTIVFENVTFSYPSRPDVKVLDNINFACKHGEITALVGPSGSGKSTCISLIEHFYEPNEGRITINNTSIETIKPIWLHSNVALVSQEPVLFGMSIGDNIRYGVRRAVTDEEVQQAAEQANAHDFISQFPDKYDTKVGERGVQLSGGQKQRVAIARAILVDPSILLLDEATSALDAESEHIVQEALDRIMENRTTIVIAHRLSTVKNADCILVLENGKIVESGPHHDLVNKNGLYANLVRRQLKG